jgi:biopolymer transport protein ExbD
MSDVAFLLLIFIMLASLAGYRREVPIAYPAAETAQPAQAAGAEKKRELWIDRAGAVYLDGVPATLEAVEAAVGGLSRNAADTPLHLIADRDTPFADVHRVLQILQRLQCRLVSFVVKDA